MGTGDPSLPPGWYTGDDGARRHWDGSEWTSNPESETSTTRPQPVAPKRTRNILIGVAAGTAILISAAVAIPLGVYVSGADWRTAESECRPAVVDRLKSPSTATLSEVEVLDEVEYQRHLYATINGLLEELGVDGTSEEDIEASLAEAKEKIDKRSADGKRTLYVIGVVDSENGFSAMVRNEWTCEVGFENGQLVTGPTVDFAGD